MAPKVPKSAWGAGKLPKTGRPAQGLGSNGGNSHSLCSATGMLKHPARCRFPFCRRSSGGSSQRAREKTRANAQRDERPTATLRVARPCILGGDNIPLESLPWHERGECIPLQPPKRFIRGRHETTCSWHSALPRERRLFRRKRARASADKSRPAACTSGGPTSLVPSTPNSRLSRSGRRDSEANRMRMHLPAPATLGSLACFGRQPIFC